MHIGRLLAMAGTGPNRCTLHRTTAPSEARSSDVWDPVRMVIDGYAILRPPVTFDAASVEATLHALIALRAQGPLLGVIHDLRGHPGGDFMAGLQMGGAFAGLGILALNDRRVSPGCWQTTVCKVADELPLLPELPLVGLTNSETASAAETSLGSVRSARRYRANSSLAVLIGSPTKGKDFTVQEIPLADGFRLWLPDSKVRHLPMGAWDGRYPNGLPVDVSSEAAMARKAHTPDPELAEAVDVLKTSNAR